VNKYRLVQNETDDSLLAVLQCIVMVRH